MRMAPWFGKVFPWTMAKIMLRTIVLSSGSVFSDVTHINSTFDSEGRSANVTEINAQGYVDRIDDYRPGGSHDDHYLGNDGAPQFTLDFDGLGRILSAVFGDSSGTHTVGAAEFGSLFGSLIGKAIGNGNHLVELGAGTLLGAVLRRSGGNRPFRA